MTTFFYVDLEQVAQVVERRRGVAKQTLLLDRSRLGVALRDDQPAEGRAIFARHFLPHVLPHVVAKAYLATRLLVGHEDTPSIVGHWRVAITGPTRRINANGSAQIDVVGLEIARTHFVPPVHERGLPVLQRTLQLTVLTQLDVVGDQGLKINSAHACRSKKIKYRFKFGRITAKAQRTQR